MCCLRVTTSMRLTWSMLSFSLFVRSSLSASSMTKALHSIDRSGAGASSRREPRQCRSRRSGVRAPGAVTSVGYVCSAKQTPTPAASRVNISRQGRSATTDARQHISHTTPHHQITRRAGPARNRCSHVKQTTLSPCMALAWALADAGRPTSSTPPYAVVCYRAPQSATDMTASGTQISLP